MSNRSNYFDSESEDSTSEDESSAAPPIAYLGNAYRNTFPRFDEQESSSDDDVIVVHITSQENPRPSNWQGSRVPTTLHLPGRDSSGDVVYAEDPVSPHSSDSEDSGAGSSPDASPTREAIPSISSRSTKRKAEEGAIGEPDSKRSVRAPECPVCLIPLESHIMALKCGHVTCRQCMQVILQSTVHRRKCPICRAYIRRGTVSDIYL
ncbi:hypothetical protein JTE90_015469 [Oedothorax gibbosus]|uniref:RING-type domain-containing protein n=1 Tax=Oedothorax gibbosus TaxID=931172 RepID=A0AAV6UAA6_9ARAC|nr:hypothetical protein JTE90_015469 [Oedothorax gibbosus]